jgi:cardiolipin synthase
VTGPLKHIPNVLTGLRLLAAPALAFLLLLDHYGAALAVFAFAGLSDLVDGYLAKRYHMATRLGRYLDPAADKALMFACFVVFAFQGVVPLLLAAVVIGRDVLMILGIVAAKLAGAPLTVTPLRIGKLTTVVQVAFIALELVALAFALDLGSWQRWAELTVGIVTVASAWTYGALWLRAMRRTNKRSGRRH